MENIEKKNVKGFYIFAVLMILFDQVIKFAIKGFPFWGINHVGLHYGEQIPVIGTILNWTYIENPGMAFGIQFGWAKIFLSLFSIVASILLAVLIFKLKNHHWGIKLGFSLIFAGATGNLIDRVFYGVIYGEMPLFYGKVVDFIQVDIPDISFLGWTHFPIFNIADSCVTVGVVFLLLFNKYLPHLEEIFPFKKNTSNNLNTYDEKTNN